MDVRNLSGRWALVTGAGHGIGRATALALAQRGADLVLCDLNEVTLQEVSLEAEKHGSRVLTRRIDVSKREEMQAWAEEIHRDMESVDILVNNAGVAVGGGLLETELDDWDWLMGVNLWGVVHGLHFFVPAMVKRGHGGHVVNIASVAGFYGAPGLPAYCGSKFAVVGISESIRAELAPHDIGVTAICPAFIQTGIFDAARMRGEAANPELREEADRFIGRWARPPERVAERILHGIQRNKPLVTVNPEARVLYAMKRFAPRSLGALTSWLRKRAERRILHSQK